MIATTLRLLRYAWAAPATLVGLAAATLACALGATWRIERGTMEVAGGRVHAAVTRLPRRLRFEAITFGHVVIGRDHARLARLRAHEQVHVAQYERWGVLFFPAYLGSSAIAWIRGRDPYRDNRFEREAFGEARPRPGKRWTRC